MALVAKAHRVHAVVSLALIVALAALFWAGSRYPALDEKAMMSGAIQLEDNLSFEARIPITDDMGTVERIGVSTLNWIDTNKKGMTFGVLFAAAFLTGAAYLRRRSFEGAFSNSVLGMVVGAPLGVCVNCAAPIAKGMYAGGMRAETTLSAMIASPTLNIVVLTMLFSILPFYMAVTKIALSLLVILVVVPLVCRVLSGEERAPAPSVPAPTGWDSQDATAPGLLVALLDVGRSFVRNLWFIVKMTVPLMLLAGFLGALVATLLPGDLIMGVSFGLIVLVLIALVGVFLPVPIAFDVVVAGALLGSGLEHGYVMALLFTLGSFSVYSFFIIAQAISLRAASLMAGAVVILGVLSGLFAQQYYNWQSQRALDMLLGSSTTWGAAHAATPAGQITMNERGTATLQATPFAAPSPAADTPFTRQEAWHIGIDKPLEFSMLDMWPPFWEGRSVTSGDIDRDGDLDLVIASTQAGLYLYDNVGAGQFARLNAALGALSGMPVFNAVLADFTGDGWADLFLATYREGNFLVENRLGSLDFTTLRRVANRDNAVLSLALSVADPDRDGDLDVALGNWTAGWYRRIPGEESRNRIVWNDGTLSGATFTDLPGIPGETLSILFTDINRDGAADLLVGNDFEIPDIYYHGDGEGGMNMITHGDGIIPHTTTTTMAIKSADLHNDAMPELYLAQIAGRSSGVSQTLKMQPLGYYCDSIERAQDRAQCDFNMAIKTWYKSGNNFDPTYASRCQELSGDVQAECKAMLVKDLAIQRDDPKICALIPAGQPRARSYCELHFLPARQPTAAEAEASYQQILRSNVLLQKGSGPSYEDVAEAQGLDVGGWSWDTKIADFDNDGWQDVYIVNGTWVPNEVSPSNLFFHNQGDGTFAEASGPFGLEDYLMTAAASAFDIDNDGDLDIVAQPVNGPVALFRNNAQTGNAVVFELDDGIGNRDGIGAVLEVTDTAGITRTREVQLGGGFMSFDAPRVHVGLGRADALSGVVVHWADGSRTQISGPLPAGQLYRIKRAPG